MLRATPLLLALLLAAPASAAWSVLVEEDAIRVTPPDGDGGPAHLLLSHVDPILGEVADRVVPLHLAGNESALVGLDALPLDAEVRVRVVPGNASVVRERSRILEDDAAGSPVLATLEPSSPLLGNRSSHLVVGHPVTPERWLSGPFHLVPYDDGRVGVVWNGLEGDPVEEPEDPAWVIRYAESQDGGRTFGDGVDLAPAWGNNVHVFDSVHAGNTLWVTVLGEDGLRLVRVEGGTVSSRLLDVDPGANRVLVAVEDGLLLAVGHHDPPRLTLHRLDADGALAGTHEADLDHFESISGFEAHAAGDRVLLAWSAPEDRTAVAWSLDGGRSLGPPRTVEAVGGPRQVLVDEIGGGHVTTNDGHATGPGFDGYLLSVPVVGEASVRRINGPGGLVPDSYWGDAPRMAAEGTRLWLVWEDANFSGFDADGPSKVWGIESLDLGATFGSPYRIRTLDGAMAPTSDMEVLPDGRPATVGLYGYTDGSTALSYVPFLEVHEDVERVLTRVAVVPAVRDVEPGQERRVEAAPERRTSEEAPGPALPLLLAALGAVAARRRVR